MTAACSHCGEPRATCLAYHVLGGVLGLALAAIVLLFGAP